MKEKSIVLRVEPGKDPEVVEIENTLESQQKCVGGYIEVTYPFDDRDVGLITNEEGKLIGLEQNRIIRRENGRFLDNLVGTFLIVGLTEDDFCSLKPEQIEKYKKLFSYYDVILP